MLLCIGNEYLPTTKKQEKNFSKILMFAFEAFFYVLCLALGLRNLMLNRTSIISSITSPLVDVLPYMLLKLQSFMLFYVKETRIIIMNSIYNFLGLNVPINNKTMSKNTLYASVYNEFFINGQKPIFDRNRLYGALGYVINTHLKVEAGFMAQTLENTNRNQFQIVLFNNIPFNNK